MEKTMNTNQLHDIHMHDRYLGRKERIYPKISGSLVDLKGNVKKLTQSQCAELMEGVVENGYKGEIDVTVEFKDEKEGLKIAKTFSNLAQNPAVKLNVKFKNISNDKNKN
jgi:hypothetical protein